MNIRALLADDLPALARLMAGDPLWQRYGVTEAAATRRLAEGLAVGATIAVAVVDDAVAGFIWYVARGAFNRSGYIMLIGVEPWARGRGVATCDRFAANLDLFASDFLDGRNVAGRHSWIWRHLSVCNECRQDFTSLYDLLALEWKGGISWQNSFDRL